MARQLSHAECFCDIARELILPLAHIKIPAPGARIERADRRRTAESAAIHAFSGGHLTRTPAAPVSDYNALPVALALLHEAAVETSQ
jgi:hypothetical protein